MTLLHDRVTSDDIARVVAKATGIPVTNLLKGEKEKLIHVSSSGNRSQIDLLEIELFFRWKKRFDLGLLARIML
jgi:hypothetical protein